MSASVDTDLRQLTLVVAELDETLDLLRARLGLEPGFRDRVVAERYGLVQEVMVVGRSFIEVMAPNQPYSGSAAGRFMIRNDGDGGYLVSVQVPELDPVIARLRDLGVDPVVHEIWEGSPVAQWHPRDLGVLLEADEIAPGKDWHFDGTEADAAQSASTLRITNARIAVEDPQAMASRWATAFGIEPGGVTLQLSSTSIDFFPADGGRRGLTQFTVATTGADDASVFVVGGVEVVLRGSGPA